MALAAGSSQQSGLIIRRAELGCRFRALEVRRMPKEEAPAEIRNAIALKTGQAQGNDGGILTWSAAFNIKTSGRPTKIDSAAEIAVVLGGRAEAEGEGSVGRLK